MMVHPRSTNIEHELTRQKHLRRELMRRAFQFSLAAVALIVGSDGRCDARDADAAGLEFFEKQIRPLLVTHCFECHSGSETNGGLELDSREAVSRGGDSGDVIVPGEPDKSRLIEAVRYKNPDLQMPPGGPLAPAEVAALEKWVRLGAPDPRTEQVHGDAPKPAGMSIEAGRDFWSFKPVASPTVPEVQRRDWARTPIDAFVLARLEARGLEPAPAADKRALIRRVTFDLTGLPPTPEEIDAFLADAAPDAFEKLVERLMSAPGYGVRWGRHWLDVARYADSNGLDENLAFGNAWRYRDYVVNAFNNDKPFDRFLIEQLAGDLLPAANEETRTATGFLALGAKVLAEPDREKLEMDTIDEQLDTLGKAFLGMTIGCARCHDHKFDPLKQRDYYALAAIFKSTKSFGETQSGVIKHWYEHSFATPEQQKELEAVDKKIADAKAAAESFKSTAMEKLRAAARAKATEYLVAAAAFEPSMPLTRIEAIATPLGLHPRILHHCRLHLEYHRDHPFFGKWHSLAEAGEVDGIDRHYRPLFTESETAFAALKAKNQAAGSLEDPRLEAARAALHDAAGFLAVPPKPQFAFDGETLAEYHRLADEARVVESNAADAPAAMGVTDGTIHTELPIHIRGNHRNLGEPVARGFPEVMQTSDTRPILPDKQSGRLELARWMASPRNPLTARVYVNRVWRWHFGAGLVSTTENFGSQGDRPSHPELLDWLARYFVESGWSTKALHRLILASNTYQMASLHSGEATAQSLDPENRLLWKFRLTRLDAEQIRDAMLSVSGRLDESFGGKTVPLRNRQFVFDHTSMDHTKYDGLRRALYLPVIRNNLYTLFQQFDFPDPTMPTGDRSATVVAPQALFLMNSELVMDSSEALASILSDQPGDDAAKAQTAYQRVLGRPATDSETQRVVAFIAELAPEKIVANSSGATQGSLTTDGVASSKFLQEWSIVCQSLFASNEFCYVK
jgi:hypothetical protein